MVYSSLDIRGRLEGAYPSFHTLLVHKIPDVGLAQRFESIVTALTARKDLSITPKAMTDAECEKSAKEIFHLYDNVKTKYVKEHA